MQILKLRGYWGANYKQRLSTKSTDMLPDWDPVQGLCQSKAEWSIGTKVPSDRSSSAKDPIMKILPLRTVKSVSSRTKKILWRNWNHQKSAHIFKIQLRYLKLSYLFTWFGGGGRGGGGWLCKGCSCCCWSLPFISEGCNSVKVNIGQNAMHLNHFLYIARLCYPELIHF